MSNRKLISTKIWRRLVVAPQVFILFRSVITDRRTTSLRFQRVSRFDYYAEITAAMDIARSTDKTHFYDLPPVKIYGGEMYDDRHRAGASHSLQCNIMSVCFTTVSTLSTRPLYVCNVRTI